MKQKSFAEINVKDAGNYACEDADVTLQLFNYLSKKLNTLDGQQKLYRDIENPLIKVIAQIEHNGVMIDSKSLEKQSEDLENRIKNIISSAKLPIDPPNISKEKFIDLMQSDKKTHNNQIYLVLQKGIGKAILTQDYPQKDFLHTLQQKTFS